ncbi:MAG: carbohydrate kinase family protein [Acidimicrobiia bacterium]|nr:carbohydrate kinase family protein [Acidimicrobiia bacterium]
MTAERSGIVCVGCVVVDLGKVIDAYPEPNRMALIDELSLSTGGPALNMVVGLAQLEAPFPRLLFGAIGQDPHGDYIRAECERRGIDASGLQILPERATSFTDVMLERDGGRRTMFYYAGTNDHFDATTIEFEDAGAKILHAGAPGTLALMDTPTAAGAGNGWSALLERGREAGLHTNMELVDIPVERTMELVPPCLPHLDSLIINELEAGALTGLSRPTPSADGPVDWATLDEMARRLVGQGVSTMAVIHFPAGCVAATADGTVYRQGSVRVPAAEVRSAVGAGDAFAAGVLYGVHEDWSIEASLRLAVASAAACLRVAHTSEGIKPAEVCLAEADELGYRQTS